MPRGVKITPQLKRQIAYEYVTGKDLSLIAEEQNLNQETLYRLRRNDRAYREMERELEEEALDRFRLRLKRLVSSVLGGLLALSRMSHDNEVTHEAFTRVDPEGRTVRVNRRTFRIDPKILFIKYQAHERLLDAFLRVVEGEVSAQQSERLFEMREQLLEAYGVATPSLVMETGQRPSRAPQEREHPAALVPSSAAAASLSELLSDLLPRGEPRLSAGPPREPEASGT